MKTLMKGMLMLCCAALTTVSGFGAVPTTESRKLALSLNDAAVEQMRAGKTEESLRLFAEALATDPGCGAAARNYGKLLLGNGRVREADEMLATCLKVNPTEVGCAVLLAQTSALLKDEARCRRMTDIVSENEDKTLLPGLSLLLLRQGSTACAHYAADRAIDLDPEDAERWFNRGVVLEREGDARGASMNYAKAVELKPDYASAWINLGNARERLQEVDGMVAAYEKAVSLDPGNPLALYNLGRTLVLRRQDVGRGLELLQRATRGQGAGADAARKLLAELVKMAEKAK